MPKTRGTCQDDPWVTGDNNPKADNGDVGNALSYNYLLNSIESHEDAAKQLTSVNALLIGGYIAVLMNGQGLGIVRDILVSSPFSVIPERLLDYTPIIPIGLWFLSIIFCLSVLDFSWFGLAACLKHLFNTKRSSNLDDILANKHMFLEIGGYILILGLFLTFIIMAYAIPYQISGIATTWNDKGVDLMRQEMYAEAIQDFNKSIEIKP
jgi:hypothetical protein